MISWLPFFGGNSGALRAGIGTCLSVLSFILFREAQPFQNGSTNVLAVTAQYQIMVSGRLTRRISPPHPRHPATHQPPTSQLQFTFVGAMIIALKKSDIDEFSVDDVVLGIILFLANLLVVGMAWYMGWNRYKHDMKYMKKVEVLSAGKMEIVNGVMTDARFEQTNIALKELLLMAGDVEKGKLIGAGAFGEVFKGTYMGQEVAIKTMKEVTTGDHAEL